jgi:RNA polymerase sigma-70 factor (ECF subfamily)
MRSEDSAAQAIEQLYHDFHQPILRYLERLVTNRETAEDLVHETFIKALRHWDQHDPAAPVQGWLYRIATNAAYDYLRRKRQIAFTVLTDNDATTWITPAIESRLDDAEPILAALRQLPEHYRTPMLLSLHAGYSHKDIAATLKSSVQSVKTRVHRARAQFRQLYVA